ncbi:MFS transporter [Alkalilimnicola ehrlichii]|uniref:MFS transporter n=1 Tax=Alkalilimnicola ehrlichii TaxID=351052 RepID=UPI000E2F8A92|nr:MFS transporter [Alkalilimnicola ehrlichii]RFA25142.1 MFS transporter [Alkalilimnicola ehrlichii]
MFDFANQAYTLLIITVIFGDLFTHVIVGDAEDGYRLGNLLWSLSLAVSYFMVVVSGPVCGAIMDFSASKKRFLFVSYLLTVISTAMLYFVSSEYIWLGVLLIIVSNFAYAIGESFVASFLPDLGPPQDLGKISGFGWAMGYIGGLFAAGFALALLGEVSAENFDRVRWVGPLAAVFFLVTAIPTFLWVRERGRHHVPPPGTRYLTVGFQRLRTTLNELAMFKDLVVFLTSVFFAMCGIYIIITFAFIYGSQVIGWDEQTRVLMFIIVQISAAAGAIGFGLVQDKIGAKVTYNITLAMWVAAVLGIYGTPQMTEFVNEFFGVEWQAQHVFLVVGCLAGLSLGPTQSASRTLVGLFAPHHKAAEFFGFWGLASKLAAMIGVLGLGILQTQVGLQGAILFCGVLFALALLVSLPVNQARGVQMAERADALEAK